MYCCANCFNDHFIESEIRRKSKEIGNCNFCGAQKIEVIAPSSLRDYFQPILDLYERFEEHGKPIGELLQNDWMLFVELSEVQILLLIYNIMGNEYDGLFRHAESLSKENIFNWEEFKKELKYVNRYFPQKAPSDDHIAKLVNYISVPQQHIPQAFYRARINIDEPKIEISNMGKPPAKLATAGRANPIGIPYLYVASDVNTAISEIRPHKGDVVTIATFCPIAQLLIADLRNPRQAISPFQIDEDDLKQILSDIEYLCHLGEELSKPVLPREAHLEYLPSQYLCELIKHCGFDGLVYKSSVGNGDNYVMFNDIKLKPEEKTEVYKISIVNINSVRLED